VTDAFCEGQIVTVFRSRLREDADPRYDTLDASLRARAAELGGTREYGPAAMGERMQIGAVRDPSGNVLGVYSSAG
jgi:hypothetical protein